MAPPDLAPASWTAGRNTAFPPHASRPAAGGDLSHGLRRRARESSGVVASRLKRDLRPARSGQVEKANAHQSITRDFAILLPNERGGLRC